MQASNILHISRVVHLESSNIDEFITHAHFMLDNEGATIPHHLESMEKQPLMKITDFHSLVIKMTHTSPHIMKRHRPSLIPYPVCAWEKVLCTLLDVDETTLNTEEPVSHWIADLKKEFGNVDFGRLNSFIDGSAPNYLSVFEISKIKPTAL
jgi:hypothetical protein